MVCMVREHEPAFQNHVALEPKHSWMRAVAAIYTQQPATAWLTPSNCYTLSRVCVLHLQSKVGKPVFRITPPP